MAENELNGTERTWPAVRGRKKLAFLAAFSVNANITAAAKLAGVGRTTVYLWQEHDPAFLAAFRQADEMATDALESEAWRRAVEGVVKETPIFHNGTPVATVVETKYSDGLMTLLLKARRPDKYKERTQHEHSGPGGGPVEISDSRDELARRIAGLAARGGADGVAGAPE